MKTNHVSMLNSRRVETPPGIVIYELTAPATDETGRTWPVGTEYTPFCAGYDNARRGDYQTVLVAGQEVTFRQ